MNDFSKNIPAQNVTAAIIKDWKRKHPHGVYELNSAGYTGYVRMPTDAEMMKVCTTKATGTKLGKMLIKTIWLGGDLDLINNKRVFDTLENQMKEIVEEKTAQSLSGIRF